MADAYERRQKQLQKLRDKQREGERQGGQPSTNKGEARPRQNQNAPQQDQGQQGQDSRRPGIAQSNPSRQRQNRQQEYDIDHILEQCREYLTLLHLEWVPLLIVTEAGATDCRNTPLVTRVAWAEVVRRLDMIFWFADLEYPQWAKTNSNMRRARRYMMDLANWANRLPKTQTQSYPPDEAKDCERVAFFGDRFHALSLLSESQGESQGHHGPAPNGTQRMTQRSREPGEAELIPPQDPDGTARQEPEKTRSPIRDIYLRVRFSGTRPSASASPISEETRASMRDEPIVPHGYIALRREFVELGLLPPENRPPPLPSTPSRWEAVLDDLETRLISRQRSHAEDSAPQEAGTNRHEMMGQLCRLHKGITKARRLYVGTTTPGANFRPDGW